MTEQELLALDELQFVERAYPFALGRPADPKGLRDYLHRLRTGTPKVQVLDELLASDEGRTFAARQRGSQRSETGRRAPPTQPRIVTSLAELLKLDDDSFIENAYRLALGREADDSGRQNYRVALRTGVHPIDVLHQLLESEEGRSRNVKVPEIRAAIERRKYARAPGVRQALRAWNLLRRRFNSVPERPTRAARQAGAAPAGERRPSKALKVPPPPTLKPVTWPPQSSVRNASKTMNDVTSSDSYDSAEANRLAAAAAEVDAVADDATAAALEAADTSQAWAITVENFVGATMFGWSFAPGGSGAFSVEFGSRSLGKVTASLPRPDVQEAFGLPDPNIGFASMFGGLLQFSAMAHDCSTLRLAHGGDDGGSRVVNLDEHLEEALTFLPMRALMRAGSSKPVGTVRAMRLVSATEASIIFEAADQVTGAEGSMFIDLYQEALDNTLKRIARFAIERTGQVVDLTFRMLDADRPLLLVATDADRCIVATDCFPIPSLMSESNAPLLEYHVVLEGGKPAFDVATKIAHGALARAVRNRLGATPYARGPVQASTCVVISSHDGADVHPPTILKGARSFASDAVFLDSAGRAHRESGPPVPMAEFLAASDARHLLFLDAQTRLRPDFWSVVEENGFRLDNDPDLVHWHEIWIDGVSRPQVVKTGLLLNPAFSEHARLGTRSLLVRRDVLARSWSVAATSGAAMSLDVVLSSVPFERVIQVPVVLATVRSAIVPTITQRFQSDGVALPRHPAVGRAPPPHAGISVVINYRNNVDATVRCLHSLKMQQAAGPLEVVLVNNASTTQSVTTVLNCARELFGSENVKAIDYPHSANRSAQCNIAAVAASHGLLLFLANSTVFQTPSAVARAAELAVVPWVGSVGFRTVWTDGTGARRQSLGLTLAPRQFLFSGGSPLAMGTPPAFALDCTLEVLGNSLDALMVRRDVYTALDGLDAVAFPNSHNEIDFCFRATDAGFRHVAIGSEVAVSVRDATLDDDLQLPVDQRLIERAPNLAQITRLGFQQL